MKKKRVLLFTSNFMDIYKDVMESIIEKGMEVVWVQASTIPNNPFRAIDKESNKYDVDSYMTRVKTMWENRLQDEDMKEPFDFFLAINGHDVHPFIFDYFRKINPQIRMVLFLYDRVDGVMQIDGFFKYYDEVFSFDLRDTDKYKLHFLPIYWKKSTNEMPIKYDIFGFASYSENKPERTALYKDIKSLADKCNLRTFIKLYISSKKGNSFIYLIKYIVKKIIGVRALPLKEIRKDLYTGKTISPAEYRCLIQQSKSILDTQASYQDGLTARFMWALGAGKKIVTTNNSVTNYSFYNPDQFYILNENNHEGIIEFLEKDFSLSPQNRLIIDQYRIDNWLNTLFQLNFKS